MQHARTAVGTVFLLAAGIGIGRLTSEVVAQPQAPANYLLIDECRLGAGTVFTDAMAEASRIVAEYRKTGEYKSVRLFVHSYGPNLALYTISEPRSWAALPAGFEKMLAANPTLMTKPYACAGHSDNILSEIIVP